MEQVLSKLIRYKEELEEFQRKNPDEFSWDDLEEQRDKFEQLNDLILKTYAVVRDNPIYKEKIIFFRNSQVKNIRDELIELIRSIYGLVNTDIFKELEKKFDYHARYREFLKSIFPSWEVEREKTLSIKEFFKVITNISNYYDFEDNYPCLDKLERQLSPDNIFAILFILAGNSPYKDEIVTSDNANNLIKDYMNKYNQLQQIKETARIQEVEVFYKFDKHCFIQSESKRFIIKGTETETIEAVKRANEYFSDIGFYKESEIPQYAIIPYVIKVIDVLAEENQSNIKTKHIKENITGEELLNQLELKPCFKRVLNYALKHNNSSFFIEDLASWYFGTEEYTEKQINNLGRYFSDINKALNSLFRTNGKKYILQSKESIDNLSCKKRNSGTCIVEIPLKQAQKQ